VRHRFKLHPDSQCGAASQIEAEVTRSRSGNLTLHYFVAGNIDKLLMPSLAASVRTDGLWRHSCFEAFVCAPPLANYFEFNFAPSTQWAAYRFDRYREGMAIASEIGAPHIEIHSSGGGFELQVSLALKPLTNLAVGAAWRLGLSAVLEEADGRKSYWALAHPPGNADFHHADCFALELPAP